MYCIAFIVILAGFGYCAGPSGPPKCDARVAAGVRGILKFLCNYIETLRNTMIFSK